MAGTSAQSGDRNSSVAAAVHTLITALTQHLSQGQPEGRKEDQTLPDSTPTASEEFALAQAGLGKRHISMPLDMSHEEFFSLLKKEYPKLQALDGGWLLYKSTGGQGAGKNTLYIVPLQHEFDLTPLPADAECMEECLSSEEDIETTSEVEIVSVVHPVQNHTEKSLEEKVPCPICFESFTPQFLEIHASMCGERDQHVRLDDKTDMGHNNGKAMERQFERGLLQWQRQKGSSPTATLNVTFFGEAGVDTGALRKEFLTEVVAGIEGRFFEGPQQQRIPRYSLNDLDSDLYRTVGEILAVSLAQGGPAPAFFSPWTYLCSGRINQKVLNSDSVADVQLRELIDQVESATEHSIIGLSDEILNCGYTGNVSIPNKDTIVRAIILHAVLRLQPMLEQLREGLQLNGLLSLMSQYPDICQPLFVSGEDIKVNAEFVMTSILPQLSDKGTTRHQVELEMMNFIQDFLYEACAKTITLPVRHMRPYEKFKTILTEAFQLDQEFSNV
ncbi:G2/M phase-specific E3 ubiquitin-protein ligase [Dissostichus eleginoides]|uniref:G2/M phase-specific E3 ubiquitin-protein ligase n=1 Tax=Dissostichus eleginoides TaxID=100907 RepID=A0AAD9FB30_DISEL|nr:G2/M phase-specific E3 ubiquitin-protein ligase [Dissostichus eleginoides]